MISKKTIMKNSLKTGLLALAIATSFAACKGKGSSAADSLKTDSSTVTTTVDSTKKDTSAVPDSLKKDTTTHTTKTEVKTKTTETKKN
jgi:ABC-type glycerol-3-phosphate transport system substrate-binding protein